MIKQRGSPWPNSEWKRVVWLPQKRTRRVLFAFQRRAKAAAAKPTLTEEDLREVLQRLSTLP